MRVGVGEMVGNITNIIIMWEVNRKGGSVVIFLLPIFLVAIVEVAYFVARPDPTRTTQHCLLHGIKNRLHSEIELRVQFLAVDYVEHVGRRGVHIPDLEIKPAMVLGGINVRI